MAARRLLRHRPFLAAAIGILFGGWISDRLLKRTGSVNISRKLPIISGLLLSSCIIAANWVSANSTVIIIMSVAFWPGMVGLGWTLISDIAPENMAGLTGGIFNFCANMASIIAPLIIGVIISATGNFFYALIYVGLTALIGVIAYILSSATLSVSNSSRHGRPGDAGASSQISFTLLVKTASPAKWPRSSSRRWRDHSSGTAPLHHAGKDHAGGNTVGEQCGRRSRPSRH